MRGRPALLVLALVGAGGCGRGAEAPPPAPARSAEELLAPWVRVKLGDRIDAVRAARPRLEPTGYVSGARAGWMDTSDASQVVEVESDDGVVRLVGLEWRSAAADAAERSLRARLPAPRECTTLHADVEDYKSLLWLLPDGASVTAMRKGKTWRVTVARPPADGFATLFASCARAE